MLDKYNNLNKLLYIFVYLVGREANVCWIQKCYSVYCHTTDFVFYITRWFKYDQDYLYVNKSQFVPVIFEPPCILHVLAIVKRTPYRNAFTLLSFVVNVC
jgi:hypothetical protein